MMISYAALDTFTTLLRSLLFISVVQMAIVFVKRLRLSTGGFTEMDTDVSSYDGHAKQATKV